MHLTTLKKLLEQNSVLKINKLFESKFDVTLEVDGVKKKFVEDFCSKNGYKLCESAEDTVLAMMSKDSDEAIDYLAEQGYVVVPNKSRVINEYRAREGKVISEDKIQVVAIAAPKSEKPSDDMYPYFKKIPVEQYDLACPHCDAVMREKDFSFKYDSVNKCWTHTCKPDARMLMDQPEYSLPGLDSLTEESFKLFLKEDADLKTSQVRLGLAVYGSKGYQVLNDDGNPEIKKLLKDAYPNVPRGNSFGIIRKEDDNGVAITAPTGDSGAGGMRSFVTLCVYGSKDQNTIQKAARRIIDAKVAQAYRYGLEKIAAL